MNKAANQGDQFRMTEKANPEKRPGELARWRDKARELLIDVLFFGVAVLAGLYFEPQGIIAHIVVFGGAFIAVVLLHPLLWALCTPLLWGLSAVIHLFTISLAISVPAKVLTMFLPLIAEAYWIWALWPVTGTLVHPLTLMCVAWLALLAILVLGWNAFADRRRPQGAVPR
jgi:hypothetical protein